MQCRDRSSDSQASYSRAFSPVGNGLLRFRSWSQRRGRPGFSPGSRMNDRSIILCRDAAAVCERNAKFKMQNPKYLTQRRYDA